ncbi:MAG: hypothetical protein RBS01_02495 [Candidatus Dojkabacteria bacterium]|jgi:hypothetical protein|nr:hypothetical protein [Candidatus Dojkabacteria bacterium]
MDIEQFENRELISFSPDAIEQSDSAISEYVHRKGKEIDLIVLINKADRDMITILDVMLDQIAQENITEDSTDLEIDTFNESFYRKGIFEWNPKLRNILEITFIKKVRDNLKYATPNVDEELIKKLYLEKYPEDISYIWLFSFREKLRDK